MAKSKIRKLVNEQSVLDVKIETVGNVSMVIPECCRELWEDCPHMLPKEEKQEFNPF